MSSSRYSIKDLENLTGIKAHTIRIWEQRYALLQPERTETNIRYYGDEDLKKILNINLLYTNGLKISKIAKLNDNQIIEEAGKLITKEETSETSDIDTIILIIMEMDPARLEAYLENMYKQYGLENMYQEIIVPLLERIGELWQLNSISVGHEHFFSYVLRKFISAKIYNLENAVPAKGKIMFFLHPDEQHELSLLLSAYLFKKNGYECCYIGQNVPMDALKIVYETYQPDFALTNFVKHIDRDVMKATIIDIIGIIQPEKLIIGGYNTLINKDLIPSKSTVITDLRDLKKYFV